MSNFGLKILYQIVNDHPGMMCDRSYAPQEDMEALMRSEHIPLFGWETREPLANFELVGFSLQYELTYTNVLNLLDLSGIPIRSSERSQVFPIIFGGGPSAVNPEPLASFMDFYLIGDGERSLPHVMEIIADFKREHADEYFKALDRADSESMRYDLLVKMAKEVPGIYVPSLYEVTSSAPYPVPKIEGIPDRVKRQTVALSDENQPTRGLVPYLALVHDREVLEVRRGCDRGCRFCQPGYTFLPVRERSTEDLLRLSKDALNHSGNDEYSMLSLCVSDYTSLHDSVRALNEEHTKRRTSLSFPSQRADRMNLDIAEELKVVRKSGITLAPEAGTERMRAVINKGLSHEQILSAIESAYQSGWSSIKLYFMCGLPTEGDEDLAGIIQILDQATRHCNRIRNTDRAQYKRAVEFTCTISNFVPKPFTPFQWFGQFTPEETKRKHGVLREQMREYRMKNVQLNLTDAEISLLEAVISRGDRQVGEMIYGAFQKGCTFDAWDDKFKPEVWNEIAASMGLNLKEMACTGSEVGSSQPWDVVHIGLNNWWLVKEWEKALATLETAPCTENLCHACGVCTELDTTHFLAAPKVEVMKRNPFVKELAAHGQQDSHPSIFFTKPPEVKESDGSCVIRFEFHKIGQLRFISHLDLQHLFARAARRAMMAVAYTQGFNPSPRIELALPLPLFQEGKGEVAEIELVYALEPSEFMRLINEKLPAEVQVTRARRIEKTKKSLNSYVKSATYKALPISIGEDAQKPALEGGASDAGAKQNKDSNLNIDSNLTSDSVSKPPLAPTDRDKLLSFLNERVLALKNADSLPVFNADGKSKDIRPGVISIKVSDSSAAEIELLLATGPSQHVKPSDVLAHIASNINWRVTRESLRADGDILLFEV
ncbi:MAG: TIGR03960 family B12-binding radical SAM protein [Candidatus Melainabacteria bacterium]|nr:TIGR03960 family B12-binding radical SAM protein [Candidatus Melainabacteria bacterium]